MVVVMAAKKAVQMAVKLVAMTVDQKVETSVDYLAVKMVEKTVVSTVDWKVVSSVE